jgi:hypothetical protein
MNIAPQQYLTPARFERDLISATLILISFWQAMPPADAASIEMAAPMNARLLPLTSGRSAVEFKDGAIEIDASIVGAALGLAPEEVLGLIRASAISSACERGVGDDAGRHRLTFFYKNRRLRLVVDDSGSVVQRSMIDFGDRPMPAQMHRIGE